MDLAQLVFLGTLQPFFKHGGEGLFVSSKTVDLHWAFAFPKEVKERLQPAPTGSAKHDDSHSSLDVSQGLGSGDWKVCLCKGIVGDVPDEVTRPDETILSQPCLICLFLRQLSIPIADTFTSNDDGERDGDFSCISLIT